MPIEISNRKSAFVSLKKYCHISEDDGCIEVTLWTNNEGFDVTVNSHGEQNFHLTFGQLKALKKLIKKLDEENIFN